MAPQIVAISGPLAGRSFPLADGPLSLGRAPESSVVTPSARASRNHAQIRREAAGYVLYDLGSSNGTRVNGRPIQSHLLRPGDLFEVGDDHFRFEDGVARTVSLAQAAPPPQEPLQQPLPPLPAGRAAAPRLWPLLAALAVVVACTVVAGAAGGILYFRAGSATPPVAVATAGPGATAPAEPAATAAPLATAGPRATPALPASGDEWTILVYLDGDNNLEPDAITDFREMAAVGSTDQLNVLVQLDRISSEEPWDDDTNGDWAGTLRFRVEEGMRPTPSAALADLGEVNMGDPESLADFIAWGVSEYPARRYALVIWDHGASWLGIASDDTDDGDTLTLPELGAALDSGLRRADVAGFDLIGFDACLMAQIDVFQAIAPFGQVAVASAELEPNDGWAWDAWLGALAADPAMDARALAPIIVDTYVASFEGQDVTDITLSAFDLTRLDPLVAQLDTLSRALIDDMGPSYTAIGEARSYVEVYSPSYPEEFNAVDLGHFARLLVELGASDSITSAALRLEEALVAARIANGVGQYHPNSSGLSTYFPQVEELYVPFYEEASPIPRLTRWDEFLGAYHLAGATEVTRPTISDLLLDRPVATIREPATLTGQVAGSDIAYVFAFIGKPNLSRDTVELLYVDFIYPPGSGPGDSETPSWPDGSFDLSLEWDATSWYLESGETSIPVLLGPIKYGTNLYGVEGTYISASTGERIEAAMVFEVEGEAASLIHIWGFPRGDDADDPQPFELTPASGDSFSAYARSYTDAGDRLEPGRVEGETITFTDAPVTARFDRARSGEYVMGFLVRDISGNFSYDYVDVTADNSGAWSRPGRQEGL